MLFLLRNIRRKLLTQNKVITYLLYAIGEILLVVIGILIAVKIDDWSEQKKMDAKAEALLMQIQDEVYNTIEEIDISQEFYTEKDSLYQHLKINSFPYEDFAKPENWELRNLTYSYSPFIVQNEGFKSYIDQIDLFSTEHQKLSSQLKKVFIDFDRFIKDSEARIKIAVDRQTEYARTQPWFGVLVDNDTVAFPKFVDYLANDHQYRNEAIDYRSKIFQASIRRIAFKKELVDLYLSIDTVLHHLRPLPPTIANYYGDLSAPLKEKIVRSYEDGHGFSLEIIIENDDLALVYPGGEKYALLPLHSNHFFVEWENYAAAYLAYDATEEEICLFTLYEKNCFQ